MVRVLISEQARRDLEMVREQGIEQFGQATAERHLMAIRHAFEMLETHPLAGQARPEFRQDVRSIPRRPHRILYTISDDTVLIVRIIHQARDVPTALASIE